MQKPPHHSKDIITKDAIKTIAIDIATLILKLKINDLEFIDMKSVKKADVLAPATQTFIEKREADIVATCKIDGIKQIIHIEIQNSNDNTMSDRMLRYYLDIKTHNI